MMVRVRVKVVNVCQMCISFISFAENFSDLNTLRKWRRGKYSSTLYYYVLPNSTAYHYVVWKGAQINHI